MTTAEELIDESLRTFGGSRSLIAQADVIDLLLDLRRLLADEAVTIVTKEPCPS